MGDLISRERLAELVALHETPNGCDDCPPHEVGLIAKELAELRSAMHHPVYGSMVEVIEEMREHQKAGYEPRIGHIGALYYLAARFMGWRAKQEE